MKALTFQGTKNVKVQNVPDPRIEDPEDIIVRVTSTAICGSDLHIYRGRIPGMKKGDILGHEFMGVVEEIGKAVKRVKRGDRVVVPFAIACGECYFCEQGLFAACENTNPGPGALLNKKDVLPGAGRFGYTHRYGGYDGGQAEYVRVPHANVGPFKIQNGMPDERVLFLSDILPTGYQAAINADIQPGTSVAIFGAGPVGYMSAACARLLGAERLFMIDHNDYRLDFAADTYGAETINFDRDPDPAKVIVDATDNRGVDAAIDAIGFEAKGSPLETKLSQLKVETSSGKALRQEIAATRRGGTVSVPGVYAGSIHGFLFGDAFEKGLTIKAGQTHVHRYMGDLMKKIEEDELRPDEIISHVLPLSQAAEGYRMFDEKIDECRKVVLKPAMH